MGGGVLASLSSRLCTEEGSGIAPVRLSRLSLGLQEKVHATRDARHEPRGGTLSTPRVGLRGREQHAAPARAGPLLHGWRGNKREDSGGGADQALGPANWGLEGGGAWRARPSPRRAPTNFRLETLSAFFPLLERHRDGRRSLAGEFGRRQKSPSQKYPGTLLGARERPSGGGTGAPHPYKCPAADGVAGAVVGLSFFWDRHGRNGPPAAGRGTAVGVYKAARVAGTFALSNTSQHLALPPQHVHQGRHGAHGPAGPRRW